MSKNIKTNIPWLPEISSQFEIGYVKNYFDVIKDPSNDGEPERVLKLARAGIVEKDVTKNEGQMAESYSGYNRVKKGDLLLNPMDLYSGANCNVSYLNGVISPAYSNLRAKNPAITNSKFYDYYFKTQYWTFGMFAHGKGVSFDNRWTLNNDSLKNYEIPVPFPSTQNRIVEKIQTEEGKINNLILCIEQQIEKLKQYKQSLISEVVTKGLDSNVEMKDSGIEWLGRIPSSWKLQPFKSTMKEREEKNNPIISKERLSLSIELGITLYADKTTNLDRFKDDFTQYKIVHEGDLVMNSMNMIVGATDVTEYFGCVSPAYYSFYDNEKNHVTAKYFGFLFKSKTMLRVLHSMGQGIYSIDRGDDKINTCRLKVPKADLKSMIVPVPSKEEQKQIVEFLNAVSDKVDKLISIKNRKIEKLNDYKKSLIYEYVTGKKEVV